MFPMEEQEAMVKRWGDAYGVGPELREFFSSEDGKNLVEAFRSEAEKDSRPDPEILPFILIWYVWTEANWERLPPLAERKRIARLLNQAAREIRRLSTSNILGPPERAGEVVDQLARWGDQLRGQPGLVIGERLYIVDERPSSLKRHRATRRVVFFLTGYFRAIGRIPPPWSLITKILKATKLVESEAKVKNIDSWWLTVIEREVKPEEPLEPDQDKHVQLFYEEKRRVAEGCQGPIMLRWAPHEVVSTHSD